jgi:phosphonopyruvate decarboxylase
MIASKDFFAHLKSTEIGPFVGVPCSLITALIAYAVDHSEEVDFVNPAHESHAMAFAAGSYLATGKLPMVFLQNSGFGNIINPLTSLNQIYDIPALLLVTWRAEEGYGTDAPEHWIVGRDMEAYFKTFNLPYKIMTQDGWKKEIDELKAEALKTGKPTVLCVRKGSFEAYKPQTKEVVLSPLSSLKAIEIIKNALPDAAYLSTTGMISRESFTAKDTPDFYMMGSMGLISGIAAGAAAYSDKKIVVLDGDGAVLMHMGILPLIGSKKYKNLLHIVLDNEAYSSTGGQPTVAGTVDFPAVAKASGYAHTVSVASEVDLLKALKDIGSKPGPVMLHVKVASGNAHGIARVSDKYTCPDVAKNFSRKLRS